MEIRVRLAALGGIMTALSGGCRHRSGVAEQQTAQEEPAVGSGEQQPGQDGDRL